MPRVVITFPDSSRNYGYFYDKGDEPYVEIAGENYTIEALKSQGAVAVVNNDEMLRRFGELGLPARPTPRQYKFTISVSENTHDRLRAACEKEGRNASRIIEQLLIGWLDEKKY